MLTPSAVEILNAFDVETKPMTLFASFDQNLLEALITAELIERTSDGGSLTITEFGEELLLSQEQPSPLSFQTEIRTSYSGGDVVAGVFEDGDN